MSWSVEFRDKSGQYSAVDLPEEDAGTLNCQFEDAERRISFDELTLTLNNINGNWDDVFSKTNLPPTDLYPNCYGFRLKKDGVSVWEGDLDYASVKFDEEKAVVNVTVADALARLKHYNAAHLKRDYTSIAIVSGTKDTKILSVNSVLDANGEPLTEGDEIKLAHVKANGKIVYQTLIVNSVNQSNNTITFKKRLKCEYNSQDEIEVVKPWYRGKTAEWLMNALLDLCNWPEAKRSINYENSVYTDVVDIADFEGKNAGEALHMVAEYVNCLIFCDVDTIIIKERTKSGSGTILEIDDIMNASPYIPVGADRYDLIKINGRDDRKVQVGISPLAGNTLEIDFPFSRDRDRLKSIADRYYDYWARYRPCFKDVAIFYDGNIALDSRVSVDDVAYKVTRVSRDLSDTGVVTLDLIAEEGILPDTSLYDEDTLEDDDEEPPPPLNFTMTKSYSDEFKALWPAEDYPRLISWDVITDEGPPPKIQRKMIRLYEFRWTYPYDEKVPVWRFYITIWRDGKDRDTPRKHKAIKPIMQSNGYYYAKIYLPAGKKWWADCQAVLEDLRQSEISDANSSSTEDDDIPAGAEFDAPVITGVTLSSETDDISGTNAIECNLKATVQWTGQASHIRIKVVAPNSTYYHSYEADQSGETFEFPRMFKRGKSLHCYVRAWNVAAKTDWYDAGSITAGGSAIPTPAAATIESVDRTVHNITVNITLPNDPTIGDLVLFKAPSGTTGNPPSSSWKKIGAIDVSDNIANGDFNIQFDLNKLKGKKAFICKTCSRYDKTIKTWSAIYDENSIGDYDFSYSSSFTRGDIEDTINITLTKSGGGAISELEKIQICKGTTSAPSPEKRKPPIECVDYGVNPPACTNTAFEATVTHAAGATPSWWMRFVLSDGRYLKPTGHIDGWIKVGSGGTTTTKMPAPDSIAITRNSDGTYHIRATWNSGRPAEMYKITIYATDYLSANEDINGMLSTADWGYSQGFVDNSSSSYYYEVKLSMYYKKSAGQSVSFTATDVSFKVAVAANKTDNTTGYFAFATHTASASSFDAPTYFAYLPRSGRNLYLRATINPANNPTHLGLSIRLSSPAIGLKPSTKPTTWASWTPDNSFVKATITAAYDQDNNSLSYSNGLIIFPAGTTYVYFTIDLGSGYDENSPYNLAGVVGINGTAYSDWGLKYDEGSSGGGGTAPPVPQMVAIAGQIGDSVGIKWIDGKQYYAYLEYKTSSTGTIYTKASSGVVASIYNTTIGLNSRYYYRARLKSSDGIYGDYTNDGAFVAGSTIT